MLINISDQWSRSSYRAVSYRNARIILGIKSLFMVLPVARQRIRLRIIDKNLCVLRANHSAVLTDVHEKSGGWGNASRFRSICFQIRFQFVCKQIVSFLIFPCRPTSLPFDV